MGASMPRVGFLGLGIMGRRMVGALQKGIARARTGAYACFHHGSGADAGTNAC